MILVTGGTGLLGAHLLYKLASNNEKVRAIYRNEQKLNNVKKVFSCYTDDYKKYFDKIDWIKADILDIPALNEALIGVDYVYHSAALVSFNPNKYHLLRKTNIEGTANIVNLCLANGIKKLCYVSSVAALGKSTNNEPISENSIWNPEADNHVYGITKYGAEIEVWRGTQEGLNTVIVNPGVILGAGIWDSGTGELFAKAKKGLKYYTSGSVGLVAIDDVVDVMILLMKSNITNERYVLVAESWDYKPFLTALAKSVKANPPKTKASLLLLKIIWKLDWLKSKLTGKGRLLTKHLVEALTSKKTYSSDKIKKTLNFSFKPIDKSIEEIGANYLKQD